MSPTVETYSDTAALVAAAGDRLVDAITSAIDKRGKAQIVLTGGGTGIGLLKRVDMAFRPELFVNHYGSSEIYTFTVEPRAPRQSPARPARPGSTSVFGSSASAPTAPMPERSPARMARSSPTSPATRRSTAIGVAPTLMPAPCAAVGTSPATPGMSMPKGICLSPAGSTT